MISIQPSNLSQAIKAAAMQAMAASRQCNTRIGTVTSISPLNIQISDKVILEEDFIMLCENVTEKIININDSDVTVRDGLKVGDTVLMLMETGGQMFYVIDRLEVDDDTSE